MPKRKKINRLFLFALGGGLLIGLGGGVFALLYPPPAEAGDAFSFLARVVVTENNVEQKTIRAYATIASAMARNDLLGTEVDFKVYKNTKFYKDGVRVKQAHVIPGTEWVLRGVKKESGRYVIKKAVARDRSFDIRGILQKDSIDTTRRTFKIKIKSSTYKPKTYKNKIVEFQYDDNTAFRDHGRVIETYDFNESYAEKEYWVRVIGSIEAANRWEVHKFFHNIPAL
jgi:hypothetical protein